jgi:glycosyltransferase involved in cell wall biosynthesis
LLRGKDRGISHAFNLGISASNGSYILMLNAGDTYSPDFLNVCFEHARTSFIICGSTSLVTTRNDVIGIFAPKPRALWRGMHLPHNWMCVPASFYKELGVYREIPDAMDYEWCKRVIATYGRDIFKSIPGNSSHGTYSLGGHSDKRYLKGLSASKYINIEYGMPTPLANLVYLAYLLKYKKYFLAYLFPCLR